MLPPLSKSSGLLKMKILEHTFSFTESVYPRGWRQWAFYLAHQVNFNAHSGLRTIAISLSHS